MAGRTLARDLCGGSAVGKGVSCTDFLTLGAQLRWKYVDRLALLLAAGTLTVYTLSLLIGHL